MDKPTRKKLGFKSIIKDGMIELHSPSMIENEIYNDIIIPEINAFNENYPNYELGDGLKELISQYIHDYKIFIDNEKLMNVINTYRKNKWPNIYF